MADDVTITVHVRDLTGPGFASVTRNINQLQRNADGSIGSLRGMSVQLGNVSSAAASAGQNLGGGMGLRGQAIAAGAALGTTLLPTIGALAPMLTGLGVVGGGAALAMDDLKKKAKQLKQPFEEWQKVANKAVAPHTEKAVKSLKSAMDDLNPVIKIGADTFGRITEKAARFVDSPAFQSAFAKNAEMGSKWVEEFAGSVGTFTQAFLDFGTKSQPALDAWDNLLGGFLDRGLPGMFKEMEQGIGGSSDVLDGLAYLINDSLLPSVGRIAGSFSEAFGPLLKEMLITAGDLLNGLSSTFEGLMEVAEPVGRIMADAWRAVSDVLEIGAEVAGSFARNVGGELLGALLSVAGVDTSGMTGGFTKLSDWVDRNENTIRTAFYDIAGGITNMVITGLTWLPQLYDGFKGTIFGIIKAADLMISGLAEMFGDMPIVGEQFKEWNEKFDSFAGGAIENLDAIGEGLHSYADEAIPRASRAQLKMNVEEAQSNLAHIKEQLKDPELTKERRARLTAEKKQAEDAVATATRKLNDFNGKKANGKVGVSGVANALGGIGSVGAALSALNGRTAVTYVSTLPANAFYKKPLLKEANGGLVDYFADGGVRNESHIAQIASGGTMRVWNEPETGGEAYIPLAPGKRTRSREVAAETVSRLGGDVEWFAKGGVTKAEREARKAADRNLTISHFGRMAGYQRSEFASGLANASGVGSLVDALNQWRSTILKATHGGTENRLLKQLDSTGKKLLNYERQLDKASTSLQKSRDRLNELKQAASQLRDSVKSGVLSSANITRGASGDGPVTVASIMGGLRQSRDKATAFSKALGDLRAKGLSGALLQQVAEAGVDGGGLETAGALLRASSSEIQSMNSMQSQITSAAVAAGKTTADAVYAGQIKTQEKLVKAWETTTKSLQKSMDNLAKSMEKAVEKAFGKKAAGGIVGAAASGGIRSNLTWVGEQGPELVNLAPGTRVWSSPDSKRMQQQAWASMLNTPRRAGGSQAGYGGSGGAQQTINVVLEVRAAASGNHFDDALVQVIRKAVSVRGGDVQQALGRGRYRVNGQVITHS